MLAKTATTEEQVTTAVEGVTEELINVIEGYQPTTNSSNL